MATYSNSNSNCASTPLHVVVVHCIALHPAGCIVAFAPSGQCSRSVSRRSMPSRGADYMHRNALRPSPISRRRLVFTTPQSPAIRTHTHACTLNTLNTLHSLLSLFVVLRVVVNVVALHDFKHQTFTLHIRILFIYSNIVFIQ